MTEVEQLQNQLKKAKDRLEYEVNKYERQIEGLRSGYIAKLNKDLKLELENLDILSTKLNSVSLNATISNMKQILNY